MNYTLKYYPDPGIAFDISRMLFVKLNSESIWQETLTTIDSCIDESAYIHKHAESFPMPNQELLLFVFKFHNKGGTFLSQVINTFIEQNFKEFSINCLINYFNDIVTLQKDLISYYLGEQNYSVSDLESIIRINKIIPDRIKLLLLGFLINPHKYISLLSNTIQAYYSCANNEFLFPKPSLTIPVSFIENLITTTYTSKLHLKDKLTYTPISYSLCFTTPDFLLRDFTIPSPFLITTEFTIQNTHSITDPPHMIALLDNISALNDKYRITILHKLIENQSMSMQEISLAIGLSLSATNHHISLLKKANMISSSRHYRTVYYSYNPDGIKNTVKLLQIIEKGEIKL